MNESTHWSKTYMTRNTRLDAMAIAAHLIYAESVRVLGLRDDVDDWSPVGEVLDAAVGLVDVNREICAKILRGERIDDDSPHYLSCVVFAHTRRGLRGTNWFEHINSGVNDLTPLMLSCYVHDIVTTVGATVGEQICWDVNCFVNHDPDCRASVLHAESLWPRVVRLGDLILGSTRSDGLKDAANAMVRRSLEPAYRELMQYHHNRV